MTVATFTGEAPIPPDEVTPVTVWSGIDRPDRTMAAVRYEDRAAADDHMRSLVEREAPPADAPIPDIRGLTVLEERGVRLGETAIGSGLAAVHFVVSLGHGGKVSEDVAETLSTLSMLPGYTGHILARNVALDDELWALIAWEGHPPVPPKEEGITFERFQRVR